VRIVRNNIVYKSGSRSLHISTGLKQCVVELGHQTDLKFMMIVTNNELNCHKACNSALSDKKNKIKN